jgi:hypothetical protein
MLPLPIEPGVFGLDVSLLILNDRKFYWRESGIYFVFISSESEQELESHGKKGLKACVRSPDIRCIQLSHQSIEQFAFLVSLLPHLLTHSEAPKSVHSLSAEKHERLFLLNYLS